MEGESDLTQLLSAVRAAYDEARPMLERHLPVEH
jgi:hypothetical protein